MRKLVHAIYRDFLSCKIGKFSLDNFSGGGGGGGGNYLYMGSRDVPPE